MDSLTFSKHINTFEVRVKGVVNSGRLWDVDLSKAKVLQILLHFEDLLFLFFSVFPHPFVTEDDSSV